MSVFSSKKKRQQAEQAEREQALNRPAAYTGTTTDAMDKVIQGMMNSGGFGWDSSAQNYQQHRALATENNQKAAAAAAAQAQALSGGYGSSYADSVAAQGARAAAAKVDDAVPSLRAQALSQYQTDQSQLMQALAGMADTEQLGLGAYGLNQDDYMTQLNYLANQSELARQVEQSDRSRAWDTIKAIGSSILGAYDAYKGYSQQKWENDFAREQWEFNKNRYAQQDTLDAYQQAFGLYQAGAGDAASQVLSAYGLDPEVFAGYSGAPVTKDSQMDALSMALQLAGSGADTAARQVLSAYGLDSGILDDYIGRTAQQRQLELALDQATLANRRSSGSSSSSGGGYSSGGSAGAAGLSDANLLKYLEAYNEYQLMGDDTSAAIMAQRLAESGYNVGYTPSGSSSGSGTAAGGYGLEDPLFPAEVMRKNTAVQSSRVVVAMDAARRQLSQGKDLDTVMESLARQGYSDQEIYEALNRLE